MSRQRFNLVFNIAFAAIMLAAGWLIPDEVLSKIEVDVALLFVVLMAIYELQDEKFGKSGWGVWVSLMLLGIFVFALSLRLEHVWIDFFSIALHGHFKEATTNLASRPHANTILFIAFVMLVVGIAGMIRLGMLKLLGLYETTDSERTSH